MNKWKSNQNNDERAKEFTITANNIWNIFNFTKDLTKKRRETKNKTNEQNCGVMKNLSVD